MKVICLVVTLIALPAFAQTTDHSAHQKPAAESASSQAFAEVNAKMHMNMAVPLTGNADVDFIAGMIPHHQGAVDMARVVLQYGTDPEVRKLAEGIIASQESEIAWMTEWLAKQPK